MESPDGHLGATPWASRTGELPRLLWGTCPLSPGSYTETGGAVFGRRSRYLERHSPRMLSVHCTVGWLSDGGHSAISARWGCYKNKAQWLRTFCVLGTVPKFYVCHFVESCSPLMQVPSVPSTLERRTLRLREGKLLTLGRKAHARLSWDGSQAR